MIIYIIWNLKGASNAYYIYRRGTFCDLAIEFCKDQNIKYADMPITEYVKAIIKFEHGFNAKTVPQIFNEEEYIGGYTDLLVWAGKLLPHPQVDFVSGLFILKAELNADSSKSISTFSK